MVEKEKLVIADDMDTVLMLEEILLKKTGYEIIKARTGTEALKKIQAMRPRIALLDLVMPEMNGDAICRFIKSNSDLKHIKVIIITSHGRPEDRERAVKSGCDHFLTKPVNSRELLDIVTKDLP
ncbi:MAG: response regulator [Deltaproteobacteria bacterium]|nr:response regulator [Deltaproteobacteria bacterium]MCL5276822.1 response regulator [Deltaproteobacteria bacterium]